MKIMYKELKAKLLGKDKWKRIALMLIFYCVKRVVATLIDFIALFQIGHDLIVGAPNPRLLELSRSLNNYLLQLANFLTFNSETRPFPFAD